MRDNSEFWKTICAALGFALVGLVLALLTSGCAPQRQKPIVSVPSHAPPTTAVPPITADTTQPEVVWGTTGTLASNPVQKSPKRRKRVAKMAAGGKVIVFEPGEKYSVYCPSSGTLTIKMPEGERLEAFNTGASGEWMVDSKTMGLDGQIVVVTIRRAPWAPTTELHVITDAEVYPFILIPQQNGVSKRQPSIFTVINPETEARRIQHEEARMEEAERRRREQENRQPQEAFSLLGRAQ